MDLVPGEFSFQSIAIAETVYRDKFGVPRQCGLVREAWAFLRFKPEFQPEVSLQGLEKFSHLWLIWVFHQNSNQRFHAKVHPPRLLGKTQGIFATRTPHRPNPIGLSLVKLDEVTSEGLRVSGVDLVHGTPILDVKPYLPEQESVPAATNGWLDDLSENSETSFKVEWSEESLQRLVAAKDLDQQSYMRLVEKTLSLDPRPQVYKKMSDITHASRIYPFDVHFRFDDQNLLIFVDHLESL